MINIADRKYKPWVFVSFSTSLSLHLEFRCCIDRLRSHVQSGYRMSANFNVANGCTQPEAASLWDNGIAISLGTLIGRLGIAHAINNRTSTVDLQWFVKMRGWFYSHRLLICHGHVLHPRLSKGTKILCPISMAPPV